MLTNHHAHTHFSDGVGEPEDYVRQALREGFSRYGFSDHAPIPHEQVGSMEMEAPDAYTREIERLRGVYGERIQLFRSMEVDYIPGVIGVNSPHILRADLDYTLGAVHYVDYLPDGEPWSFQRPNPTFERGLRSIFGGDARRMVERYYELIREMVVRHPPDVVVHLDRVKRQNADGRYWDEHADWYLTTIERTLDTIAAAGCILEVNTRGLYLGEIDETYPSRWILALAHARGIRLQVNSDAHRREHISGGFERAYAALREIGVREVHVFDGAAFAALPLTEVVPV